MPPRGPADLHAGTGARGVGRPGGPVSHQFDPGREAELADLADRGMIPEPSQLRFELVDPALHPRQQVRRLKQVERGQGGRRGQRIAGVGVT